MKRTHVALILAAVSGCGDAIGFVALGGAFTSVMTGNLVLTGVALAHGEGELLLRVATAVVAYIVGCAVGARVAGRRDEHAEAEYWPAGVTRVLVLEIALTMVFALVWWLNGRHPGTAAELVMLGVVAAALGAQSAAVNSFGVSGLSTTYLTGTLTLLIVQLAHRKPLGDLRLNGQLLVALVVGAVSGATLVRYAHTAVPFLPLALLCIGFGAGLRLSPSVLPVK